MPIKYFGMKMGAHRSETGDYSIYDDGMTISVNINNKLMDYEFFVKSALPVYIEAMQPYLVELIVSDESVASKQWPIDAVETKDFRDGVRRIWPANFWDRELCRRAFHLTPEQVVRCLEGHVAEARVFMDGALIVCSHERIPNEKILAIDGELRPLLKAGLRPV